MIFFGSGSDFSGNFGSGSDSETELISQKGALVTPLEKINIDRLTTWVGGGQEEGDRWCPRINPSFSPASS